MLSIVIHREYAIGPGGHPSRSGVNRLHTIPSATVIVINTLRDFSVCSNYRLLRLCALCGGRMILDMGSGASSAARYLGRGNIKHFYGRHYSTVLKHDIRARVFCGRTAHHRRYTIRNG